MLLPRQRVSSLRETTAGPSCSPKRIAGTSRATTPRLIQRSGRGLEANIDGEGVFVGKAALFAEVEGPALPVAVQKDVAELEERGRTTR